MEIDSINKNEESSFIKLFSEIVDLVTKHRLDSVAEVFVFKI